MIQATLAAVGLLASVAAWLAGATFWGLVGGLLLGAVIPFTLIVILPTNKQLLNPTLDKAISRSSPSAHTLGRVARREKCTQRSGTAVILVLGDFWESSTDVGEALRVRNRRYPRTSCWTVIRFGL